MYYCYVTAPDDNGSTDDARRHSQASVRPIGTRFAADANRGDRSEWLNVEMPKANLPRLDLRGRLSSGGLCHIECVRIRHDADVDQYVS